MEENIKDKYESMEAQPQESLYVDEQHMDPEDPFEPPYDSPERIRLFVSAESATGKGPQDVQGANSNESGFHSVSLMRHDDMNSLLISKSSKSSPTRKLDNGSFTSLLAPQTSRPRSKQPSPKNASRSPSPVKLPHQRLKEDEYQEHYPSGPAFINAVGRKDPDPRIIGGHPYIESTHSGDEKFLAGYRTSYIVPYSDSSPPAQQGEVVEEPISTRDLDNISLHSKDESKPGSLAGDRRSLNISIGDDIGRTSELREEQGLSSLRAFLNTVTSSFTNVFSECGRFSPHFIILLTEFLERIAFFSIQGTMSLYLITSIQLTPSMATFVNQLISASTYLLALGWGLAADTVLGRAKTAAIGLGIYVVGVGAMLGCSLLPVADSDQPLRLQPGGVALLIIGVVAFVGGASAIVATLGTLLADQRPSRNNGEGGIASPSENSINEQVNRSDNPVVADEESGDAFLGVFRGVFSTYFALLNLASVVAFVAAPALAGTFGFAGSFGLAAVTIFLACILFASSYPKLVKVAPSANLKHALQAINFALKMGRISRAYYAPGRNPGTLRNQLQSDMTDSQSRFRRQDSTVCESAEQGSNASLRRSSLAAHEAARASTVGRHWLDPAKPHYGDSFVEGLKSALYTSRMLIPLPIYFWLYFQTSNEWVVQGLSLVSDNNCTASTSPSQPWGWSSGVQAIQIQALNPASAAILAPLIYFVFPSIKKWFKGRVSRPDPTRPTSRNDSIADNSTVATSARESLRRRRRKPAIGAVKRVRIGLIITGISFLFAMSLSAYRAYPNNPASKYSVDRAEDELRGPWEQVPQYILLAFGGILAWPAILELAYLGSPRTLRCCIGALLHATAGIGSLLGVAASSIATAFSATECRAVHTRLGIEFAIMAIAAWFGAWVFGLLAKRYQNPHPTEFISVSWEN